MTAFLLDANLSPETSDFLRTTFGYDVVDLLTPGLAHLEDPGVVDLAMRTNRVIITFDHDIPERYHRELPGQFGVILLRLEIQTIAAVNRVHRVNRRANENQVGGERAVGREKIPDRIDRR